MAKKWNDYTGREKVIGVMAAAFAVFTIGGIANAMGGTTAPSATDSVQVPAQAVRYEEVEETESIPFSKQTREDNTINLGEEKVTTVGVDGIKTKTYKVTYLGETETGRELIREVVTKEPIGEVTSIGTYVAPARVQSQSCDSNYSGACVPIASDVDCAGGSGNGPAYVSGPVNVIGSDIYDLDRDGNGVGCE